jgi:hypothetical protein
MLTLRSLAGPSTPEVEMGIHNDRVEKALRKENCSNREFRVWAIRDRAVA